MGMRSIEHPSASAKLGDRFASKSQSKHARQLTTISPNEVERPGHTSSLDVDQRSVNLTTRQYARLVAEWLTMIGLEACLYGTHSLRRTKATLIYKKTGNLRAVQLLLGHTKIESTVRYLGIEVDDALAVAEQIDV
jgi:integrase